jgi:hypothetical protein
MWGRKEPKPRHVDELLPILLQLDRIEDKCDFLIKRTRRMTVAYDELSAAVSVAVSNIAELAAKIDTAVIAGTSDEQLAVLTTQLKAATDAVVAVLNPPAA